MRFPRRALLLVLALVPLIRAQDVAIGDLSMLDHDVAGSVSAVDSRTLRIKGFSYDGTAPAVYWWVGKGAPSAEGERPLTVPDCAPVMIKDAADGTGDDVVLELPEGMELKDIDYLSVWCEEFKVDFGNIVIDASKLSGVKAGAGQCATGGAAASGPPAAAVAIGDLSMLDHDVAGSVSAVDSRTLSIKGFKYDGSAPAVYWWVGKGAPSAEGKRPLTVPDCAPVMIKDAADGTGDDVVLELPEGMELKDIDYLSVWCEEFKVDFGNIVIDASKLSGVKAGAGQCAAGGAAASGPPAAAVAIGDLSMLDHDVAGSVSAVDSRTLSIKGFKYDGSAPAVYWWVGKGAVSAEGERPLTVPDCAPVQIKDAADGTGDDVVLELPEGMELKDIDYLSVWCEEFKVDFGNIVIDASKLKGVAAGTGQCGAGGVSSGTASSGTGSSEKEPFPVPKDWNCESLSDEYQVRWVVEGDMLAVELVANAKEDQYMGFGPSGSKTKTFMVGSDVVIARGEGEDFTAVDYSMDDRSPCSGGKGVCPDDAFAERPGNNDVTNVSGKRDGDLLMVRYKRPLAASDPVVDVAIDPSATTFITWAVGPFSSNLPRFHETGPTNLPTGDVKINFGRKVENKCKEMLVPGDEVADVPGFTRDVISDESEITARIGPSAGNRGVSAIMNVGSWGIAWYMSPTGSKGKDILIPAIGVQRGKTYTFSVQGGSNADNNAKYHPLYITDNKDGGLLGKTPTERASEKIFAGITDIVKDKDGGITNFTATAFGDLCQFGTTPETPTKTEEVETFANYYKTLNTSCVEDAKITRGAGKLTWTVPNDAPDVLYYQCVTHPNLGGTIGVYTDEVDEEDLKKLSGGASLSQQAASDSPKCSSVTFKGETREFGDCGKTQEGLEVYWTVRESDNEIDTLFRAANDGGYVGFGWGATEMLGSMVAIAYEDSSGEAQIADYSLVRKESSGVQPDESRGLTNMEAEVVDGVVTGSYTRKIFGDGLSSIDVEGATGAIWAFGAKPGSATTLQQHSNSQRGVATFNLADGGLAGQSATGFGRVYKAHGILMSIAWLFLVPLAIFTMRYFKRWNAAAFHVHAGLNSIAVIMVIVAFSLAAANSDRTEKAHLTLGSIALAGAGIQVLLGLLRPGHDSSTRKPWHLIHAFIGSCTLIIAFVNVFIGLDIYEARKVWTVLAGVLIGVFGLLFAVFGFLGKTFPTTRKHGKSGSSGEVAESAPLAPDAAA